MITVAVLVGSLRAQSINRRFAKALERLAEGRARFVYPDLGALPLYNNDLWEAPPEAVLALKTTIERADAVLFVTPEHNRFPSSAMFNATEWASRPHGKSSFIGKPAAVVGATPGVLGTAAAQVSLRSLAVTLGAVLMGQPEVHFSFKPGLIDDDGRITDPATEAFLRTWVDRFVAFVEQISPSTRLAAE